MQVFYFLMDAHNHWLYVIDVAPRADRMVQETQDLTLLEDFDRVIEETDETIYLQVV